MEEWRLIDEESDYEVSTHGRVRRDGAVFVGGVNTGGYLQVDVRGHTRRVHRLVAEAFLPKPEGCDWVLHNDGDRSNNRVSNLRWGTPKDNMQDRIEHGMNTSLSKTHCLRGHLLEPPNLLTRRGSERICRACERARQSVRRNPLRDLQEEADRYYAG